VLADLSRFPPQLVICDLRMPELDGIQLLQLLREHFPRLRSILLTGQECRPGESSPASSRVCSHHFCAKPYDARALQETVQQMAPGGRPRRRSPGSERRCRSRPQPQDDPLHRGGQVRRPQWSGPQDGSASAGSRAGARQANGRPGRRPRRTPGPRTTTAVQVQAQVRGPRARIIARVGLATGASRLGAMKQYSKPYGCAPPGAATASSSALR